MTQIDQYTSNPEVASMYEFLLNQMRVKLGPFDQEYKKTSIHVVTSRAFLGIHFMKNDLRLNIVLDHIIDSERLYRCEQVSKRRFHNVVRLSDLTEIDDELLGWIEEAYRMTVEKKP
ncbi:MAG: DUF5655 domain-containing protein [Chloroflexi bacterium]|nr:DUF5655 domain-containing protein [Chloroflexota bacterium]MCL5275231.1 DUF5655 domain-containing protein [Chloroflexota bacterium]